MARRSSVVGELVGRNAELQRVLDAVDAGRPVLVLGERGVGRTAFFIALAERLTRDGRDVVTDLDPTIDRRGAPEVHVVDDAHLLDAEEGSVLRRLVRGGDRPLVASAVQGAGGTAVAALRADPRTEVVGLAPLPGSAMVQLLDAALPGTRERRTEKVLLDVSEGRPLHLLDLVEGSRAAGSLVVSDAAWRLVGELHTTRALDDRLGIASPEWTPAERDVVEVLAVGGELPIQVLDRVADPTAIEHLERRGTVTIREVGGRVLADLAPLVLRVALRHTMPFVARRRHLRALVAATSAGGEPAVDDLTRATWELRAGLPPAPDRLLAAALAARDGGDVGLAAELATAAVEGGGPVETALLGSWCLAHIGRQPEAIELARRGLAATRDPFERAALHQRLAEDAWWFRRDLIAAAAHLGARDDEDLGEWSALLDAQQAVFATLDGRLADALAISDPLVDHPLPGVRFVAAIAGSQARSYTDRADEGLAMAEAAFAGSSHTEGRIAIIGNPGIHVVGQIIALVHEGRLGDARAGAELVTEMTVGSPDVQARAWAATILGLVLHFSGRPAPADQLFADAEALWVDSHLSGPASWVSAARALTSTSVGAIDRAEASLARSTSYDSTGFGLYSPFQPLAQAWVAHARHDQRRALAAAERAIDLASESGAVVHLAAIAHDLARLGLEGPAARAVALLPAPRTSIGRARLGFVGAWLGRDAARLEAVADEWSTLDAPLFAAEAWSLAAVLHRRARRTREATAAQGRSGRALAEVGGVAMTPPLARRSSAGPLTRRQEQVAGLAAQGLSSKEIAARLVIAERTVESHLHRIYLRLGLSNRAQLPTTAGGEVPEIL